MTRHLILKLTIYIQCLLALGGATLLYADQQDAGYQFYYEANQLYEEGNYEKALGAFYKALDENQAFATRFPEVQLKIAYCLYKTGHNQEAATAFQNTRSTVKSVIDDSEFFAAKSQLRLGDTTGAIKNLRQFRRTYKKNPLRSSVDSLLAHLFFQKASWDTANFYHRTILKYRGFDKGDIYGHLIVIAKARRHTKTMRSHAFTLIGKYPFHPQSRMAYRELKAYYNGKAIPNTNLQKLYTYLEKTEQFTESTNFLNKQSELKGKTELIRWLQIRQLYAEKKYWASLKESQKQRSKFTHARYKRNIDLNVARCNLRLGFRQKAIAAYDLFQRRYPHDGLSPEVLWVIAWLCEKQDSLSQARAYYKRIIRKYPRYQFVNESRYRIGLAYYREGDYFTARQHWQQALRYAKKDRDKSRFKYWISKTHYQQADYSTYLAQLDEVADTPFDSYYNLKAFLLTKDHEYVREFVDSLLWEISHKPVTFLPKYLDYFQRPLLVQEIFGESYAQKELNQLAKTLKVPGWEINFALGEMHEKMMNYGRAYRQYRKVYNENFSRRDFKEWVFLFKSLYPLYFDNEVNEYARKWNITPASIWAIIKKESAFEPVITSYANAYGLMQIIPPTANRLSESLGVEMPDVRRLFDPEFNIQLGSYYLSELLKRYEGNLYHALAAYNAGEHRVDRWRRWIGTDDDDFFIENIEFEQTRGYVRGAMKYYWTYHLLIHPYELSEDIAAFPEKVAREPWFREVERFD
mgnify:CR=1 FL=1